MCNGTTGTKKARHNMPVRIRATKKYREEQENKQREGYTDGNINEENKKTNKNNVEKVHIKNTYI